MRIHLSILGASVIALVGGVTLPACSSPDQLPDDEDLDLTAAELQSPQIPVLDVSSIPRFVQSLALPSMTRGGIDTVFGNRPLTLRMCEFWANVLPPGTFNAGAQPKTRVWGYIEGHACPPNGKHVPARDTYIGPIIVNERAVATSDVSSRKKPKRRRSTDITWVNELGNTQKTGVLSYRFSTDQTLHWADPLNNEANVCHALALQGAVPAPGSFCAQNYNGTIPAVAHLHGGEQPAEIDGSPEQWFTSNGAFQGPAYYTFSRSKGRSGSRGHRRGGNSALFKYPNVQQAAPLWFHDHTLGTTRLNVHSGLAGGYLLEDPGIIPKGNTTTAGTPGTCRKDCLPANLPPLAQAVPLVLQDRIFDTNGQFFFPADTAGGQNFRVNPQHPYWVPEFIGNTILVNGKVWPFLEVEAKRSQFLILNGSNARAYELWIENLTHPDLPPPDMFVIATDGGYLDSPAKVDTTETSPGGRHLLLQPGERYLVIIDFGNTPVGDSLLLKNLANAPLPGGASPVGTPVADILQFRVVSGPPADTSYDPASGVPLRTGKNAIVRLADPVTGTLAPGVTPQKTRQLTLNEVLQEPSTVTDPVTGTPNTLFPGGPFEILLNNTPYEGTNRGDFTPITLRRPGEKITKFVSELPEEGNTEIWEVVNLTADAHPIHLHLVQFQVVNRQDFDLDAYSAVYNTAFGGGSFIPGFGPPLKYGPSSASGGKFGGNPDITPFLSGSARPPEPYEAGWKDTIIMLPNQVTRIAVRWAPTDIPTTAPQSALFYPFDPSNDRGYVWHCHILEHEDNDMMRPYNVKLNRAAPKPKNRPLVKGEQY